MSVPVAIAPSLKTPGVGVSVNLLAGQNSPGSSALRILMICDKVSTGSGVVDTLYSKVSGPDEVATKAGPGGRGHLFAIALFKEYGTAQVDLVLAAEPATVNASATLTWAGTPGTTWTYTLRVCGREYTGSWAAGTTHINQAIAISALVSSKTYELPVTCSDNGAGVNSFVAKTDGTWGNDIIIEIEITGGATGTVDGGVVKVTKNLASGTSGFDASTALSLVSVDEYDFIECVSGNTELNTSGASTNPARVQAHIDANDTGLSAHLQQAIDGFTGTYANALTAAGYRNFGPVAQAFWQGARSLPCELQGAECGARARERAIDPAVNRIKMKYIATLYGPVSLVTSTLTAAQVEGCLNAGVTPTQQLVNGDVSPIRPITTYHIDTLSNPDFRLLDVSRVDGIYDVTKDYRSFVGQTWSGFKLAPDTPATSDPLPAKTVRPRTVKAALIERTRIWINKGVVQREAFELAVANGEFIVVIDESDSAQLDVVSPLKIVPPFAKASIVVNHVGP